MSSVGDAPEPGPPEPGRLARWLLTFLGTGWSPRAPGTAGSLATLVPIALCLPHRTAAFVVTGALIAFGVLVTLAWGGRVTKADGHGDPGWVVSDEVAGQALAVLMVLPTLAGQPLGAAWPVLAVAFGAFRLFDIVKVGPVGALERIPGAWGVLLDDVMAGILAGGAALAAVALL